MATSIRKIVDQLAEYAEIKTEQIKLKFIAKVSRLLATVLSLILVIFLVLLLLFFLSFSVGELLNEVFESTYWGYFTVTGFYLVLVTTVILLTRTKKIRGWFEKLILQIAEQKNDKDA